MTKITKKMFKAAVEVSRGTQRDLSRRLNVSDTAICLYLERNPDMKELLQNKRFSNVDRAEDVLFEQLEFSDSKSPSSGERIRQGAAEYITSRLGKWTEQKDINLKAEVTSLTKEEKEEIINRLIK